MNLGVVVETGRVHAELVPWLELVVVAAGAELLYGLEVVVPIIIVTLHLTEVLHQLCGHVVVIEQALVDEERHDMATESTCCTSGTITFRCHAVDAAVLVKERCREVLVVLGRDEDDDAVCVPVLARPRLLPRLRVRNVAAREDAAHVLDHGPHFLQQLGRSPARERGVDEEGLLAGVVFGLVGGVCVGEQAKTMREKGEGTRDVFSLAPHTLNLNRTQLAGERALSHKPAPVDPRSALTV